MYFSFCSIDFTVEGCHVSLPDGDAIPSRSSPSAISFRLLPSRNSAYILLTVIASSGTILSTVPFLSLVYPRKCFVLRITLPSWNFFLTLHLILLDMLRLSSSARLAIIVKTNSLRSCSVSRFSFSNMIPMPSAFSFLAVCTQSSVFLANRLTDFVIIRSIFPSSQSFIIRLNCTRLVFLPLKPGSA